MCYAKQLTENLAFGRRTVVLFDRQRIFGDMIPATRFNQILKLDKIRRFDGAVN